MKKSLSICTKISRILSRTILILGLLLSAAHADNISMGWEDWRPYQFKESDGSVKGLDVEIVRAVFKRLGQDIDLVELPWKRHVNNIKDGRTDIAASASKTTEREEFASFSDPYRTESVVMYIRKEDNGKYKFKKLKDIIGTNFSLAVVRGYYYGEEFEELMKTPEFQKHVQEVNDNQLAQRQLVRKRVDGFLEDPIAATIELRAEGIYDEVMEHMPIYSDDIYVMFSKKSTSEDLIKKFNESLAQIREDGSYQKIFDKYLK